MRYKKAFSRKDLSVLMICLLFLMAVCGSVGKIGRENAKRMVCTNNISQLLQGLTVYAGENDGRLPSEEGWWIWDLSYEVTNVLLDSMGIDVQQPVPVQDVFYCPSNIPQKKASDLYWSYSAHYRVIGYLILWESRWNQGPIPGSGNKKFVRTIYVDNPSETELVIDIVMSDRVNWPQEEYPNGNFARILCGGIPAYYGIYDSSSHLITDREPAGGNIGFVDGHVQWRPFSLMEKRWYPYVCPIFWW